MSFPVDKAVLASFYRTSSPEVRRPYFGCGFTPLCSFVPEMPGLSRASVLSGGIERCDAACCLQRRGPGQVPLVLVLRFARSDLFGRRDGEYLPPG